MIRLGNGSNQEYYPIVGIIRSYVMSTLPLRGRNIKTRRRFGMAARGLHFSDRPAISPRGKFRRKSTMPAGRYSGIEEPTTAGEAREDRQPGGGHIQFDKDRRCVLHSGCDGPAHSPSLGIQTRSYTNNGLGGPGDNWDASRPPRSDAWPNW